MSLQTSRFDIVVFILLFLYAFHPNLLIAADNWNEIRNAAQDINSVSAEFIQEKHLKILAKPLVSKGVLFFKEPDYLRWEYISPVQSILLMQKGSTKRYIKGDGGVVKDGGANLRAIPLILQEISLWLKGRFDESLIFSSKLVGKSKIVLTPKEDYLKDMISSIELTFSLPSAIIERVMIYEDKNSFTKLEFQNTKINAPMDLSLFKEIP